MGWNWHQLDHMQTTCTILQKDNHASTVSLNFLQTGCPSWCPTKSVKALKAIFAQDSYMKIKWPGVDYKSNILSQPLYQKYLNNEQFWWIKSVSVATVLVRRSSLLLHASHQWSSLSAVPINKVAQHKHRTHSCNTCRLCVFGCTMIYQQQTRHLSMPRSTRIPVWEL